MYLEVHWLWLLGGIALGVIINGWLAPWGWRTMAKDMVVFKLAVALHRYYFLSWLEQTGGVLSFEEITEFQMLQTWWRKVPPYNQHEMLKGLGEICRVYIDKDQLPTQPRRRAHERIG